MPLEIPPSHGMLRGWTITPGDRACPTPPNAWPAFRSASSSSGARWTTPGRTINGSRSRSCRARARFPSGSRSAAATAGSATSSAPRRWSCTARETEAYKVNLSNDPPQVHILLRSDEEDDAPHEIKLFLVTASPYEAQDYLDTEDNMLLSVAMPDDVIAWVQAFIDKHHVDEPFYKRKRERYDPNDVGFGRKPLPDGDGGKGGSGRG